MADGWGRTGERRSPCRPGRGPGKKRWSPGFRSRRRDRKRGAIMRGHRREPGSTYARNRPSAGQIVGAREPARIEEGQPQGQREAGGRRGRFGSRDRPVTIDWPGDQRFPEPGAKRWYTGRPPRCGMGRDGEERQLPADRSLRDVGKGRNLSPHWFRQMPAKERIPEKLRRDHPRLSSRARNEPRDLPTGRIGLPRPCPEPRAPSSPLTGASAKSSRRVASETIDQQGSAAVPPANTKPRS